MPTKEESLQEIGQNAHDSLAEMVAALECDYDRLDDLRDDCPDDDRDELSALEKSAGDCEDLDDAQQRIQEDPLCIEVRSNWQPPGVTLEPPAEYCILLTTGGPAVRIIGTLHHNEPVSAMLQTQDWGTMWTDYGDSNADMLLTYAGSFWYGA